jgi:hypothetical protein
VHFNIAPFRKKRTTENLYTSQEKQDGDSVLRTTDILKGMIPTPVLVILKDGIIFSHITGDY